MKYAGIGSRETPADILILMNKISAKLDKLGYTLRSGGANGADTAFEQFSTKKEIFLPWKDFNGNTSPLYEVSYTALQLARSIHPTFDKLSFGAKRMMGRNCYQILGLNLDDPVDFVVCWTLDGCYNKETRKKSTGGTGQAIELADLYKIPVYNLRNSKSLVSLMTMLNIKHYGDSHE